MNAPMPTTLFGARAPLHITAVGKLFLAEDGPEDLSEQGCCDAFGQPVQHGC